MAEKKQEQDSLSKIKWLSRFFSIAGNIAPETAIDILVKLVFTPQKRVLRPPHKTLMKKAHKHVIKVNEFRNPKKKADMKYYVWGSSHRTVLLVHGWDGMALDFYKMIPALVEAGYRVVAIDGPAHGGSDGETSNLLHFKEAMVQLIEKIGTPYAIVGHSMGGGASAYLLMEYNILVNRLVMMAIPISSGRFFEQVFAMLKVPVKMQRVFFKGLEEEFNMSVDQMNLAKRKEKIKADKAMLIYDEDDEVVSLPDIKNFLSLRPEIKGVNVKGAGHNTIIRNKKAIDEIIAFLE
ncbi:MAG TPA: alpha/beta fold hydrolase [Chitinophagales bacterium]|nr:alpha/beta fold hydrolase [Chitinophagales bacterium]